MERTESVVVSVHPDAENDRIEEMSIFGWNLQGRQEILGPLQKADTSDNLAVAIWRGGVEATTDKVYVRRDHYVKLHFARSLNMPNLGKLKEIEAECTSLPFPGAVSLKGPGCFTLFWAIGIVPALATMGKNVAPGAFALIFYCLMVALGVFWIRRRLAKNRSAEEIRQRSAARGAELVAAARSLSLTS